jgi:hypothetical protein
MLPLKATSPRILRPRRVEKVIFKLFQKDYYALRFCPAFDLQERIPIWGGRTVVPTHQLKTRKQEGSSPRVSITNLV